MVQSGGNQPVAAMPAKLADAAGAATGSLPGARAAAAGGRELNSLFFHLSRASSAVTFGNLAFGAALLSASNVSLEMG